MARTLVQNGLFNPYKCEPHVRDTYHREILLEKYSTVLTINTSLTRQHVSFQANKKTPFYRWFKYKEAFSSDLIRYLISTSQVSNDADRSILDPFSGAGTALTTAASLGWNAVGMEILPVGNAILKARIIANNIDEKEFGTHIDRFFSTSSRKTRRAEYSYPHLRITKGAFSPGTEDSIAQFVDFVQSINNEDIRYLFRFACLCILEEISYTRKDGQYLRWDIRSGRNLKGNFVKGPISEFNAAMKVKLEIIREDIEKRESSIYRERVKIIEGSCLHELPKLPDDAFDLVITSPPYANRYDYTRTYALELAFLGVDEISLKNLRQTLLSCTVENRSKREELRRLYMALELEERYRDALLSFEKQDALYEILEILNSAKKDNTLNNNNIPNLVENYFFEMNIVIRELARVLKPGGTIFMVNDNVRYFGQEVPVDLILSNFAVEAGLIVDHIWFLSNGKGNSSQQMGEHGRTELRKDVYHWTKPR